MPRIHVHLPDETVARVEQQRGLVPRSAWIARAVEQALARADDPGMVAVPHRPAMPTRPSPTTPLCANWKPRRDNPTKCHNCGRSLGAH